MPTPQLVDDTFDEQIRSTSRLEAVLPEPIAHPLHSLGASVTASSVPQAAADAYAAGLSIVPPREDGTKAPAGTWRCYEKQRATPDAVREWYGPRTGLGAVCGAVSGNLEGFDIDMREVYERFLELAHQSGLDDLIQKLETGYVEDTPSGGVHWLYRCAAIGGNAKLAARPKRPEEQRHPKDKTKSLIETRGEGGFIVLAPSHGKVHESGSAYRLRAGKFATIPTLTPDERRELHRLAQTFDEMPKAVPKQPRRPASNGRPGDDFNRRATWADVLTPKGWSEVYTSGGTTYWRRPGKDRGMSATTNHGGADLLYVFSTSTPFEAERGYSKFPAYAVLNHGGDFTAAARDLMSKGYGEPALETDDVVVMRGGQLRKIVDRAEAALVRTGGIYQRGGELTRAVKLDTAICDDYDVRRAAGSTVLISINPAWLIEQMGCALKWRKCNTKGKISPADPLPKYGTTLLGRGEWRFPVLRGVVTAPTLARDGRIIEPPGFDASSGLLVDIVPGSFPPVPVAPTKADAQAALERLSGPLRGFPFVNDAAKSVALSALLTALVRLSMRTAPLHGLDAPTAGTGKSMLAEAVGLFATGVRPPALSQGKSPEEDEKRLSTVLAAGDPIIHMDNCGLVITGDFLCSMLTQETVQARILGLSERRVLPCTALVLASGNNLTLAGDVSRRAVICRLDAQVERPDARSFDFDCHAEILASRPELVVDGLTILRAYHLAGRPMTLTPMGSFTDWDWVRGALVWLDCADPADTREDILNSDPRKDELAAVTHLWKDAFGAEPVEVADIAARAARDESLPDLLKEGADRADHTAVSKGTAVRALRDKLIEVACKGTWNGRSVGWWLRRHKDRVVGGRSLQCDGRRQWRLVFPPEEVPS